MHLQRLPAAPLSLHVVLLVGSVIVATANTLSVRETCLSANEVDVCAHASASFGDTLPGHLKVNDVVVAATNETCSAVVSQEWHDLVDTTRTWGQLLVVTFVIQAVVLLWVGCLSPSSKPGGGTEASRHGGRARGVLYRQDDSPNRSEKYEAGWDFRSFGLFILNG